MVDPAGTEPDSSTALAKVDSDEEVKTGRRGRTAATLAQGDGRPFGYTDAECMEWWELLLLGDSTLQIAKDKNIDQKTIVAGIKYILRSIDGAEKDELEKAIILDSNRVLRQTLFRRMRESAKNIETIDEMLAALVGRGKDGKPDLKKIANMSLDDKLTYKTLLETRQKEVVVQVRLSAEIRATHKDFADQSGMKKAGSKAKPKGKGATVEVEDPAKKAKPVGFQSILDRMNELPDDEIDKL